MSTKSKNKTLTNTKKKVEMNHKKTKMPEKTIMIFKIVGYFSIFILFLFSYFLFQLNVLPLKYLIPILLFLFFMDGVSVVAIHFFKKSLKILGLVVACFLIIFGIVGIYYTYHTDSFLNRSFRSGKMKVSANYFVVTNQNSSYQSIKDMNDSVVYLSGATLIEEAKNHLNHEKQIEMISYDDVITMFTDLKNGNISSILVEQTSYNLVMEMKQGFQKSDFKVIHEFEVSIEVDSNAKDSEEGKYNIYIGGNDFTNSLMDFNMIITINEKNHKVLMSSIPRDYYIPVSGYNGKKDTLSFMGARGIETNRKSLEEFLGIPLNYFIKINTKSLVGIVDQVGGIDYCSDQTYTTTHAAILDSYDDRTGKKVQVKKGCQHFNGIETLTVARERLAFKDGDRQRQKNCQQIIKAIFKRLISTNTITNYNNILNALSDLYDTNIPKETITDLIKETINGANWEISEQSFNGSDGNNYVHLSKLTSYVMNPNMDSVNQAVEAIKNTLK